MKKRTYFLNPVTNTYSVFLNKRKFLLQNVAENLLLLKLRPFPHSSSPRHTPFDNEKKKSWLE